MPLKKPFRPNETGRYINDEEIMFSQHVREAALGNLAIRLSGGPSATLHGLAGKKLHPRKKIRTKVGRVEGGLNT